MKKQVVKALDLPSSGYSAAVLVLAVSFALGVFAGFFLADCVSGEGGEALRQYFAGFSKHSGSLLEPDLLHILWSTLRWHLLTVCLGLSSLGLFGIPVLFVVRGFLLAFSVASFYSVFGFEGLWFSFLVLGLSGLVSIPVLFVLGVNGFLASGSAVNRLVGARGKRRIIDRPMILCICVCFVVLFACSLIEYCLLPSMIGLLSNSFIS